MSPFQNTHALERLVRLLIEDADDAVQDHILIDAIHTLDLARGVALWRTDASGELQTSLQLGEEESLPTASELHDHLTGHQPLGAPLHICRESTSGRRDEASIVIVLTEPRDGDAIETADTLLELCAHICDDAYSCDNDPPAALPAAPLDSVERELAHDMRNHLAGLRTVCDVLDVLGKELEEEELDHYGQVIQRECRRAGEILASAVDPDTETCPTCSESELVLALEDVVASERRAFEQENAGLKLRVETEERAGTYQLDPVDFSRVIRNLLVNARESCASPAGPAAQIFIDCQPEKSGRGGLVLSVEDDGPGIARELRDQLFEEGVTTKHGGEAGFGLNVVRSLVEAAGGEIRVQHLPLRGTRFQVWVPELNAA